MSENPLSDPDTAIADNRLYGTWVYFSGIPEKKAPSYLSFIRDDAGATLVLFKSTGYRERGVGKTSLVMLMFPSSIDGYSFMNLKLMSTSREPQWTRDTVTDDKPLSASLAALERPFWLLRYEIDSRGLLSIWLISDNMIIESIRSGRLLGKVNEDRVSGEDLTKPPAIIFAGTRNLVEFFREQGLELVFSEGPAEYRRIY